MLNILVKFLVVPTGDVDSKINISPDFKRFAIDFTAFFTNFKSGFLFFKIGVGTVIIYMSASVVFQKLLIDLF